MIFHPKINQRVQVHYRKSAQDSMPCEGLQGEIIAIGKGPGPRNVAVKVKLWAESKDYFIEIIPRGNINPIPTSTL